MKDVKIYQGAEARRTFRVTVIGTPKSGKSSLLYYFDKLENPIARMAGYFETARDEREISLQTASGVLKCVFIDNNIQDYSKATPEEWLKICETDCLICMCECLVPSVQNAVQLIKTFQKQKNCLIFLAANKSDDYDPDQITIGVLDGYASSVGAISVMCSIQQGLNMDHFQFLIADLLMNPRQKYQQVSQGPAIKEAKAKGKGCSAM
ncbi:Ras-like_GTPase superfamily protein [Hexamita inflata]|uniref:Ras-like GTPase superfamily protein n=1 Tax=Hexamita inflata TaxID=28002 RepID=A0AA86Q8W6_9EUKA|nr:Ras-like GTPase superfamily protein [Hexamita inflata]CAI9948347.1 Ras-like GTPase superfamily protein [Hexamita inflata]CAI9953363.1 Ras-like GTPase superfamily protein [Hexamita inflata]